MQKYKSFETDRLILKSTELEDSDFLIELFNTPKWIQYIGDRNIKTIPEAEKYIRDRVLPQQERLGYSNYIIINKENNVKIGICGLYDREGIDGIDIGFALLPEYEGRGYVYEASSKLMVVAKNTFGLNELSAITTKENIDSQKLLTKLGFRLAGFIFLPEDNEELMLFQNNL